MVLAPQKGTGLTYLLFTIMNSPLTRAFFIVAYAILLMWSITKILGHSVFDYMLVIGVLSPLLLMFFMNMRGIWFGILTGSLVLNVKLGVPLLDRLGFSLFVGGALLALMLGEVAMRRTKKRSESSVPIRLWLGLLAIVMVRFILDRPGSARMGGVGGLGQAIQYAVGVWMFFVARWVITKTTNWKAQIPVILVLAAVTILNSYAKLTAAGYSIFQGFFYHRHMWVVAAIILSMVVCSDKEPGRKKMFFVLSSAVFFVFGVLSHHRSRPVYALITTLAIADVARLFDRKKMLAFAAAGYLGLLVMTGLMGDYVPVVIARPLSLITPIEVADVSGEGAGELGWESGFRAEMYRLGWENIRKKPWSGKGFSYSYEEVMKVVALQSTSYRNRANQASLAMAGGYHNTLLALTVFCGIPAGILFLLPCFIIFPKFYRQARDGLWKEDKYARIFTLFTIGLFVPSIGQFFLNGAGHDFFVISTLLGFMYGMIEKSHQGEFQKEAVPVRML